MIYLNGQPLSVTIFPDNTSQVWKIPPSILPTEGEEATVKWDFSHESEFLQLAQLKLLLDDIGVASYLHMSYLPYGRQDKFISNETTFALRAFAKQLNSLKFEDVIITDPHSDVALRLIANSHAEYPKEALKQVIFDQDITMACYPDKGAVVKYSRVYEEEIGSAFVYGEKVRDQLTGHITSYKLIGKVAGENVLIVDDICDGGMTFKLLAKDLLAAGAKSVVLFVTHGIYSKGVRTLYDSGIKAVYDKDGHRGPRFGSNNI